jgi:ribose 5-phosphate isomerase B
MITISLGSDHAGFPLKEWVKSYLLSQKYNVVDFGTDSENPVDYPDYIFPAAKAVGEGKADAGIVFGGSGNGEAIVANKVKNIRCAVCWNEASARLAKEHNNANIISMGARLVSKDDAIIIVNAWLTATFQGERHLRRIQKIADYEKQSG